MFQHDFTELMALYPQVIRQMRSEFTSHEFISALTQQNQQLYDAAVLTYRRNGNPAPERTVHGILAKELHKFVDCIGKVGSENSKGRRNPCAKWRKRCDDHQALATVQSTWATVSLDPQTLRWVAEDKELEYDLG